MVAVFLLVLAMAEVGYRFGRSPFAGGSSDAPSRVVQGSAFTLLGLLLGFSFVLALGRYDSRREALVREANAIGTTYLRSYLLDERSAAALRVELRDYVASRIAFARADAQPQERAVADVKSSQLQRAMWILAIQAARSDPRSTTMPLLLASLNETIDLSTEEGAVLAAHIPDIVIGGLVLIALIAAGMMGFAFGRHGQRAWVPKILFAAMLALALGLVLDLDRPQRGIIRIDLSALEDVAHLMQR